jgi:two-component system LytT family response regulator
VLRVVIVDDEHLARQAMRRLLAAHPDVEIAGEAESLAEAIDAVGRTAPQLVFLDIELGGGGGFDLLAALEHPPVVVFVTAYPQYAADAFAVEAADYLLKPVEPERLAESLDRVRRRLAQAPGPAPEPAPGAAGLIELKTPRRTVLAAPGEIAALRADGDFTRVLLADRPELMIWRTLAHFESLLPAPPFLRLGRSLIINRDRLRGIEAPSREGAQITLLGVAEPLALGRTAAQRLREALAAAKSGLTP